jgi:Tol biopolymer transport system component
MPTRTLSLVLLLVVCALPGFADPVQVTDSLGDSQSERIGPASSNLLGIRSDGDLTPGQPGNTDGSREVFVLDLLTFGLTQLTNSSGHSSATRIAGDGRVIASSRADLTPGAPGNADSTFEIWLANAGPLEQLTETAGDTFFQAFVGPWGFVVSKGDITPGNPGNPDGNNEVYAYDFGTQTFTQVTATPEESLVRAVDPKGRYAVIQSRGDLTPGAPGNADGHFDLYLLDLDTFALTQITASNEDTLYWGLSPNGRYVAAETTGDATPGQPGNGDGSNEVYFYDVKKKKLRQITDSTEDSLFYGFHRKSRRAAIVSRGDLAPGLPGNTDGSREVYLVKTGSGAFRQVTDSPGDSRFAGFEPRKAKWVAILSTGDLHPGGAGNADGSEELFLGRLRRDVTEFRQITDNPPILEYRGFSPRGKYVALETTQDLAPGGNADGSREVYLVRAKKRPQVIQLTDSLVDSFMGGYLPDEHRLLLDSFGDLDPTGLGNADGSREVFLETYR